MGGKLRTFLGSITPSLGYQISSICLNPPPSLWIVIPVTHISTTETKEERFVTWPPTCFQVLYLGVLCLTHGGALIGSVNRVVQDDNKGEFVNKTAHA